MFDFFDIEDWMIIGPVSDELAEEARERRQIEKDHSLDPEDDDNF